MHKADKDSPVKPEDGSNGAGGRQWKGSWWFTAGYRCVSPMGRSLSQAQTELLKADGERELILLFDGDDPARDTIKKVGCDLLAEGFGVVAPVATEDFKPHRADEKCSGSSCLDRTKPILLPSPHWMVALFGPLYPLTTDILWRVGHVRYEPTPDVGADCSLATESR